MKRVGGSARQKSEEEDILARMKSSGTNLQERKMGKTSGQGQKGIERE